MGNYIGIPHLSFFGGGEPREVSEVLDEEIANHLKEIGVSTVIPIRNEQQKEIHSPVGLDPLPFPSIKVDILTIAFSASEEGEMEIYNDKYSHIHPFDIGNNQFYTFDRPPGENFTAKFTFPKNENKFSRIFSFTIKRNWQPVLISDTIYMNDDVIEVNKVFCQEECSHGQPDPNEQNMCLICFSEPATVISLPCRHCSMCSACSMKFAAMSTNCPVCRQPVSELINVVKNT